jgi:hypothetical protein
MTPPMNFLPIDEDAVGCRNSKSNTAFSILKHRHANIPIDHDRLANPARKDQHVIPSWKVWLTPLRARRRIPNRTWTAFLSNSRTKDSRTWGLDNSGKRQRLVKRMGMSTPGQ